MKKFDRLVIETYFMLIIKDYRFIIKLTERKEKEGKRERERERQTER